MDTGTIIAIVVVAAIAVVLIGAAFMLMNRKRTGDLKNRYGDEYDRTVKASGRKEGEKDLREREKRVSKLELRELDGTEREGFMTRWTGVQATFVEAPRTALQHADVLVQEVMSARGYPMSDFEQRAADISVDHADVVTNYRAAHSISQRAGSATTEEMRQAMLYYKELFGDLLGTPAESTTA
jgi:hypothetical protein